MADADEMLSFWCWKYATDAEDFYPPEETARGCIENKEHLEDDDLQTKLAFQKEFGLHIRAYREAVEFFIQMKQNGFNPQWRAEEEVRKAREAGHEHPPIDWEWLDASRYSEVDGDSITTHG
ncbi:MAG: hypothetical protein ABEH81_00945 [Halopenitus sp.]